jgi:hypothetical protein
MIAKNIHGLLAKRTGDRIGENREAKKASHSSGENLWGHDRVPAIRSRG